jgi:hypothetical protein
MNTTYEITNKSQIFIVKELLIGAVYLILGYLILMHFYPEYPYAGAIIFVGGYAIIDLIPCFIIHTQYYRFNKGTKLSINKVTRTITILDKGSTHSFSFDKIKSIKLELMSALYRGGKRGMSAWELYHYAVLETEDKHRFIITCLLVNDLRKFFDELGLKVTKEWTFFPLI